MNDATQGQRETGPASAPVRSHRLASASVLLAIFCPLVALAQVPARFYWQSLAGANAVPVIFQSLSGNANPLDPAHVVSVNGIVDANMLIAGYAKMLPVADRTLTVAFLQPMGKITGTTTSAMGSAFSQQADGFGDPMVEIGYNVIGPKALKSIPDLLRYEPGFSMNLIADLAFPLGDYDSSKALNLGQNRWYGRVGAPIVWQFGAWVPGRRTTLELLPSLWAFSDNDDYMGKTLSTDTIFQLEAHLTRDLTETLWASLDSTLYQGGASTINGVSGDALNNVGVGFTLGYQLNDNLSLTVGYMATINDNSPTDLRMDSFRISLTYGWHKIVEGGKRLHRE